MNPEVTSAIVTISLALIFYTLGVWSEKIAGRLRLGHLAFFWIGLVFDTTGTGMMSEIAGGWRANFHGITGMLAIVLMLSHALWATVVFVSKNEEKLKSFHKFSLSVWLVWLLPYLSGLVAAMLR